MDVNNNNIYIFYLYIGKKESRAEIYMVRRSFQGRQVLYVMNNIFERERETTTFGSPCELKFCWERRERERGNWPLVSEAHAQPRLSSSSN